MKKYSNFTMALAASLSAVTSQVFAQQDQMQKDLTKHSTAIHWPEGFGPDKADLFAHNEIFIQAPASTVFQRIIEAGKWPAWYPNSHNVRVNGSDLQGGDSTAGVLKKGSEFDWNTFGLEIHSRVHEYVPNRRIGWFGDGKDLHAYHTWLLIPTAKGTRVVMEECVKGPAGIALRKSDVGAMHRGHDLWDETLKKVSEQ